MRTRVAVLVAGLFCVAAAVPAAVWAQASAAPAASATAADQDGELTAIRKAVENYVAAFNAADPAAVAACWSKDGAYVTPDGERLQGEEAIADYFRKSFADNPGMQVVVHIDSLRLLSPEVAMEEGTAVVQKDGEEDSESTYLAIHRKDASGWKLDTVRETVVPEAALLQGPLNDLAWLVGQWSDASQPGVEVKSTYHWADGGRFMVQTFNVVIEGQVDLRGTQIIGWDPAENTIRSWLFDSDGGFGEGVWTRGEGEGSWTIESRSTLPDGRRGTAVNHYHRVGDDEFIWSSTDRQVDGEGLPDVEPIAVRRELPSE